MRRRRSRIALHALLLLGIGGAVAAAYVVLENKDATAATADTGRTVTVQRGTVTRSVTATGTVTAAATADVDFSTTGRVTDIKVKAGQKVKKGQRLAELDHSSAQAALRAANLSLTVARSTLQDSIDDDAEDATILTNEAAVLTAITNVKTAQAALAATYLTAPMDGTVTAVNGIVGQQSTVRVSGTSGDETSSDTSSTTTGTDTSTTGSTSSSTAFIQLTDLTPLLVSASVAEADVGDLKVGQAATVTLPSDPDKTLNGRISAIDMEGTTSSNVVTYGVTISLRNAEGVRLGQTADVEVVVERAQDVLTLPSAAVSGTGDNRTVQALVNGTPTTQQVTVGVEGDSTVEITNGLLEGAIVQLPTAQAGGATNNGFPGGGFPGGGGGFLGGGGGGPPAGAGPGGGGGGGQP